MVQHKTATYRELWREGKDIAPPCFGALFVRRTNMVTLQQEPVLSTATTTQLRCMRFFTCSARGAPGESLSRILSPTAWLSPSWAIFHLRIRRCSMMSWNGSVCSYRSQTT